MLLSNYWWHDNLTEKFINFPLYFFQESPVVYEAAADCIIALLVRLEDHDNSPFMSALELNVFTTVRRLEVRIFPLKLGWNILYLFKEKSTLKVSFLHLERVKGVAKTLKNFTLTCIYVLPTNLNGTYVYCQETGIMSKKTQNCVV